MKDRWPTPRCTVCHTPVTLKDSHTTWYDEGKAWTAHFACRYPARTPFSKPMLEEQEQVRFFSTPEEYA